MLAIQFIKSNCDATAVQVEASITAAHNVLDYWENSGSLPEMHSLPTILIERNGQEVSRLEYDKVTQAALTNYLASYRETQLMPSQPNPITVGTGVQITVTAKIFDWQDNPVPTDITPLTFVVTSPGGSQASTTVTPTNGQATLTLSLNTTGQYTVATDVVNWQNDSITVQGV